MGLLKEKVAFITGGASGIGAGTARRFIEEGAQVAIADLQQEEGEKMQKELASVGGQVIFIQCDVTDPKSVERAIQQTVDRFGKLNVVYANAGINGVWAPIDELQPDEWDKTIDINLKGTFLTIHYAVPHLKRAGEGSIIVTSSVNGNRVFTSAGAHAYSTSKAGQVTLMKMVALELGRHNIRCNAVCPGYIPTHIQDRTEQRNTEKIGLKIEMPQGNPALHEGQGEPFDVGNACVFLASDLGRHVSGIELYVDGASSLMR
jgi:NAD(P)-dependent dehydrogenase (short-subunit alcohol dehydrogenase family)